jgi:glutaminyl-peptide cyclotransferase
MRRQLTLINNVSIAFLIGILGLHTPLYGQINFSGEKAFDYLIMQTDLGPRNPGSKGHVSCLELLTNELKKSGAKVQLQPFMHYDSHEGKTLNMTNIIGSFQIDKMSRIILCAHWDTRPMADRDTPENENKPIIGANDGASGVAVLLEIARQISINPPPVGIDIVFFDGEDYGKEGELENYCLGSRYFVANNKSYFPKYAILLDMIGDAQLEVPIEGYSKQYLPELVEQVWTVAANLGYSQFIPEVRHYVFDDHVILNSGGIPAIDIIDFGYPDQSHRYWHTLEDTVDKCSPQSLKVIGDVLMEIIYTQ